MTPAIIAASDAIATAQQIDRTARATTASALQTGYLIAIEIERSVKESITHWVRLYQVVRFWAVFTIGFGMWARTKVEQSVQSCLMSLEQAELHEIELVAAELPTVALNCLLTFAAAIVEQTINTPGQFAPEVTDRDLITRAKKSGYPGSSKWAYSKRLQPQLRASLLAIEV